MSPQQLVIMEWFGVPAHTAKIIHRLWRAKGEIVRRPALESCAWVSTDMLGQCLTLARKAMDEGSIQNAHSQGWRLTPVGMADCDRAIADAKARGALS